MAVIVRERQKVDGETRTVKTYRTNEPLTEELKEAAEELDQFIEERMTEIVNKMEKQGHLDKVGSPGVLRLWYEVGKELDWVNDTDTIPPADRDAVLRALYDHAGPLHPNDEIPDRADRPKDNHFHYCHQLAQYDWEFVESAGNWTIWCEFFDTTAPTRDERIIQWLGSVREQHDVTGLQDWMRPLNREIRQEFDNIDTRIFGDDELEEKLDQVFNRVHGSQT